MQFIGGIIAYYALRQDDPIKAKNCLLLGIVLTAVWVVIMLIPIVLLVAFSGSIGHNANIIPGDEFTFLNPNLEI